MERGSFIILFILCSYCLRGESSFLPVDLKIDYLENPIGIDNPNPRFTWRLDDNSIAAKQTAYRVILGKDSSQVINGKGNVWDLGKIISNQQLVHYAGATLKPFTKYYWMVIIWNEKDHTSTSAVHSFETGMMHAANWQGSWISDGRDIHHKPAPYFRKQFEARKAIASARVYIAAAGLYELHVNGEKIGNQRLDPMYTRFDRRNLYVTHDVTTQLQQGENAVGVILGNGWYNHQSLAVWNFDNAPWRNRPAFCLDLRITYTDGSVETIPSDLSWKKADGPIIFNSIYTGEHYDARLEQEDWNREWHCARFPHKTSPHNSCGPFAMCAPYRLSPSERSMSELTFTTLARIWRA